MISPQTQGGATFYSEGIATVLSRTGFLAEPVDWSYSLTNPLLAVRQEMGLCISLGYTTDFPIAVKLLASWILCTLKNSKMPTWEVPKEQDNYTNWKHAGYLT